LRVHGHGGIPVGELQAPSGTSRRVYLEDVDCRNFTARVVTSGEHRGRPAVVLAATCFYPEGGGQPADHGTIGEAQVVDVQEDSQGAIWHLLDRPLGPGEYPAVVDADRRRDHTQQHSGQHLLSRSFAVLAGAPTVAFHLGAEDVTIDLARPELTVEEVVDVEALANRIVLENRTLTVAVMDPEAAVQAGIAVPDGHVGPLRVITIADFDRTACGGTHVTRTGEIGPVKIRKVERTRGRTRVTFHCGDRSLADYGWRHDALRLLATRLSAAEREVPELIGRALDERKALADRVSALETALARERAASLAAAGEMAGGYRLVRVTAESLGMARALATALASHSGVIALVAAVEQGEGRLVFAASPDVAIDLGPVIAEAAKAMDGRGGGKRGWAEAGGGRQDGTEAALALGSERVRERLSSGRPGAV
jgi:alanyl-tRNA synthetase